MTVLRTRLLLLICLPLAALVVSCGSVSDVPAPAKTGPGSTSSSSLTPAELVEALRGSPEAIDLIRQDPDLPKQINRKPSIPQVIREAFNNPDVFYRRVYKTLSDPWVLFGFGAQAMFFMRFFIQWIASERRKQSHIPIAFWYFSLAGGVTLFTYAVRQLDPVFMLGQGLGCFIYVRNLVLIYRHKNTVLDPSAESAE